MYAHFPQQSFCPNMVLIDFCENEVFSNMHILLFEIINVNLLSRINKHNFQDRNKSI